MQQKAEEDKRNKLREEVVNSALAQMKYKAQKKKEERMKIKGENRVLWKMKWVILEKRWRNR